MTYIRINLSWFLTSPTSVPLITTAASWIAWKVSVLMTTTINLVQWAVISWGYRVTSTTSQDSHPSLKLYAHCRCHQFWQRWWYGDGPLFPAQNCTWFTVSHKSFLLTHLLPQNATMRTVYLNHVSLHYNFFQKYLSATVVVSEQTWVYAHIVAFCHISKSYQSFREQYWPQGKGPEYRVDWGTWCRHLEYARSTASQERIRSSDCARSRCLPITLGGRPRHSARIIPLTVFSSCG